jgi:hypothetical protein
MSWHQAADEVCTIVMRDISFRHAQAQRRFERHHEVRSVRHAEGAPKREY